MKPQKIKNYLLTFFLLSFLFSHACSGFPKSFCFIKATRTGHHAICGVISSSISHGINLKVIDVLSGIETRSVVTIWDGTDFDCNGNISMKSNLLGQVGDTIIVITPIIGGVPQNTWDVAGDYRMPYYLFETAWLKVNKDTVRGYIAGAANTPLVKYDYTSFKNYLLNHNNDCLALNINEIFKNEIEINLKHGYISNNSPSNNLFSISIYTIDGRIVLQAILSKGQEVKYDHLPSGLYLLAARKDTEIQITRKIIL